MIGYVIHETSTGKKDVRRCTIDSEENGWCEIRYSYGLHGSRTPLYVPKMAIYETENEAFNFLKDEYGIRKSRGTAKGFPDDMERSEDRSPKFERYAYHII